MLLVLWCVLWCMVFVVCCVCMCVERVCVRACACFCVLCYMCGSLPVFCPPSLCVSVQPGHRFWSVGGPRRFRRVDPCSEVLRPPCHASVPSVSLPNSFSACRAPDGYMLHRGKLCCCLPSLLLAVVDMTDIFRTTVVQMDVCKLIVARTLVQGT